MFPRPACRHLGLRSALRPFGRLQKAAAALRTARLTACLTVIVIGVGTLVLGGCSKSPDVIDPTALRGVPMPEAVARPHFTLVDTDGEAYDFWEETKGKLTFLFFGYTHCPDVCPVHLANLSVGLNTLDYEDREDIRVVFVTADPARDTPEVMRQWLDAFDHSFIGLWGTQAEVDSAQRLAKVAPATFGPKQPDGSYAVGHAGQIIAFEPDDSARVVYPFGIRQADWQHDLPLLVAAAKLKQSQ